jgi:hypothetical protein
LAVVDMLAMSFPGENDVFASALRVGEAGASRRAKPSYVAYGPVIYRAYRGQCTSHMKNLYMYM